MTDIDRTAPVQAQAEAHTTASCGAVFGVLQDIGSWSIVYPELRDLQADGPAALGSTFRFKSGPMQIEANVTALVKDSLLAFEGKGKGASSTYVFHVDEADGGTLIRGAQSMNGLAVKTMKPMLQRIAETSLQEWVDAIAREAAQR
ncbi:MAG: hypothetical protein ACI867_001958 [Glaciecola sp.]|jgi:hypothetical protein